MTPDPAVLAFLQEAFEVARAGQTARLEQMLAAGLPVNVRNQNGDTLLMLAA